MIFIETMYHIWGDIVRHFIRVSSDLCFILNVAGSVGGNGEVFGLHPVEVCGDELVLEAAQRDYGASLKQRDSRVPSRRDYSGR